MSGQFVSLFDAKSTEGGKDFRSVMKSNLVEFCRSILRKITPSIFCMRTGEWEPSRFLPDCRLLLNTPLRWHTTAERAYASEPHVRREGERLLSRSVRCPIFFGFGLFANYFIRKLESDNKVPVFTIKSFDP